MDGVGWRLRHPPTPSKPNSRQNAVILSEAIPIAIGTNYFNRTIMIDHKVFRSS